MGDFLAVSAFRMEDCDALCQGIASYCNQYQVKCDVCPGDGQPDEQTDAVVYAPVDGWVRVLWPAYFNIHDFTLCSALASKLRIMVSTVHVYDGDYWEHLFLNGNDEVHRFSSYPTYFATSPEEAEKLRAEWRGDPEALASLFGVPIESISGYLVHLPLEPPSVEPTRQSPIRRWLQKLFGGPTSAPRPVQKAYPGDHHDIEDFWVFTDFWRRVGIVYPDPIDKGIHCVLRLDEFIKLPTHPDEL